MVPAIESLPNAPTDSLSYNESAVLPEPDDTISSHLLNNAENLDGNSAASASDDLLSSSHGEASATKEKKPKKTSRSTQIDLASQDVFPSLPSASGPRASPISAWAKKPSVASAQATGKNTSSTNNASKENSASSVSTILNVPLNLLAENFSRLNPNGQSQHLGAAMKKITAKHGTEIQISTNQRTGMTFLIKGKQEAAVKAKREIMATITKKYNRILPVPTSARYYIVGPKGSVINGITSCTMVKIDLPPLPADANVAQPSGSDADEEEEEKMIDISLVGDRDGVLMASQEIMNIVSEKLSSAITRVGHDVVPPSYFPFISGPHGSRVKEWNEKYNVKIAIPTPFLSSENDQGEKKSRKRDVITLQGERENVKKIINEMRDIISEVNRTTQSLMVTIPKRQHKYVIGPNGSHLQQLLEQIGCIVELPPLNDDSDAVTLRGPSESLVQSLSFVMEKANSVAVTDLDLTTLLPSRDHEAAIHLLRFLRVRERNKLRTFEVPEDNITISFPSRRASTAKNADVTIEISGKSREVVEKTRKNLVDHISSFGSFHYALAPIPIELHRHERVRQTLAKLRESLPNSPGPKPYQIELIFPSEMDESEDLLVLFFDKNKNKTSKQLVEYIKDELLKASEEAADFVVQSITIPVKFHKHIVGPKGTTLNNVISECNQSSVTLTVNIGSSKKSNKEESETSGKKDNKRPQINDDAIVVKGLREEVEKAVEMIKKVVEDVKHMEIMSSFTQSFTVPTKLLPNLIGKSGASIQKFKDIIGVVKIEIEQKDKSAENATIVIQGTEKGAEEAKTAILEKISQLADYTSEIIKVPRPFHRMIIGTQGKYVKRLESKYSVRINFPKESAEAESSEASSEDLRNKLDPDSIQVQGGKKGVESAKAEILELIEYEKTQGHSIRIILPRSTLPSIIGKSGNRINQLKQFLNVKIDFPKQDENSEAEAEVTITGEKEKLPIAAGVLKKLSNHFERTGSGVQDWLVEKISIPKHLHRQIIGAGGKGIRDLLAPYNALEESKRSRSKSPTRKSEPSEESNEINHLVSLLLGTFGEENTQKPSGSETVRVTVKFTDKDEVIIRALNQDILDGVKEDLNKLLGTLMNTSTTIMQLPVSCHASIIGRGGSTVKALQSSHNVNIQFYDYIREEDTPMNDLSDEEKKEKLGTIEIKGQTENCQEAANEILVCKHNYHILS